MIKHILAVAIAFTFAASASQAQSTTSEAGANAAAGANAGAISGSASGVILNQDFRQPGNATLTERQEGTFKSEIKNVPSVYAPSLGGGGHPCLPAVSGGFSVLGGGLSAGNSDLEVVCMLAFLGQNEAAIRALASKSPRACKALQNVGYYVVPMGNGKSKAVPFRCNDKTVKGGIYSGSVGQQQVTSATVSTKNRAPTTAPKLFSKCYLDTNTNQIKVTFTSAGRKDKATAASACQRSLGY